MLQRIPFLIMFLALFPVLLPADSPSRPEGVFNVLTFGAKGDGINDDRTAFDRATAAAAAYGPGAELRIPAGRYRIGTLANDAPGKSANLIFSKLKDVAVKGEPGTELIMPSARKTTALRFIFDPLKDKPEVPRAKFPLL